METCEFVPKSIDEAPSVYRGCSLTELVVISLSSLVVNLVFWVLLLGFMGMAMVGLGLSLLASLGTTGVLTLFMQRMKRGRPPHYHMTKIRIWAAQNIFCRLLIKSTYLKRSGYWQIGRSIRGR